MIVARFLLRFLLVPLGIVVAAMFAAVVVCVAQWPQFARMILTDPNAPESLMVAVILLGPPLAVFIAVGALGMLTPALLGILIAEIFSVRSWIFHAANGGLASWVGWTMMEQLAKPHEFYNQPVIVVAAGLAGGFAYWAVAGWNAGFWKPVFAQPVPPPPSAAPAR